MTESPDPSPSPAEPHIPVFTPVPMARSRKDGWTAERQRAFIRALAENGLVSSAARAVGMGVTSAYNLRRRAEAESFARAWDAVLTEARERALGLLMEDALNGTMRPRFYRGSFVGTAHKFDSRVALAVLRAMDRMPRVSGPRAK